MADGLIGADFRMPDAVERVVGNVRFTLDHSLPEMLHAAAVRSPYPHARITAIDTSGALAEPGVLAVITGADLVADEGVDPFFGTQRKDQPVLAVDKARYAGEPVALVVAETPEQAKEATLAVDVDYDELPYVVDSVEAGQFGAPAVHDEWPDNACGSWRIRYGDLDAGFAQADRVYDDTYISPTASHVPMEPHVCVARWVDGRIEVWTATQSPHAVHNGLREMFNLANDQVRVRTFNLGGAYGAKGQVKIEPMVACAARTVGRPVRMELARDEVFHTVGKHAAVVSIKTGVTNDGILTARHVRVVYNAGAYAVSSPNATGQALTRAPGPYRIPHCWVDSEARYTNTVPTGPFRGAMTSQLAFAYESQLDDIAADLGIDPLEIRRRNLIRDDEEFATAERLHDLHYDELVDEVAKAVDWGRPSHAAGPGRARGKGAAVMIKNTVTPSRSEARLRLGVDGGVTVYSSSVEMGQGVNATLLQLAATYLGLPAARVQLHTPDTSLTPFDTTTSSSRSTSSMGAAIRDAAARLRAQLAELAAKQLGVAPDELRHEDGFLITEENPSRRRAYETVLAEAGLDELVAEGVFASDFGLKYMDPHDVRGPVSVHWHQGAAAAEVEVDLETGKIEVLRLHGSCYAGRVVSPLRVEQQNQGCAIYGLGPTLFEEVQFDAGQIANPNLADYLIPSILDVPAGLTSSAIESPNPDAELHGVGEMALPAVAPAVANAVFAATGVRIRELPLSPERVLWALEKGKEATP